VQPHGPADAGEAVKRSVFAAAQEPSIERELPALTIANDPAILAAQERIATTTTALRSAQATFTELEEAARSRDQVVARRARLQLAAAGDGLAQAELGVEEAHAAMRLARENARAALRPRLVELFERVACELDAALARAAEVNGRLAAVAVRAAEVLGHEHGLPALLWHELAPATAQKDSRLAAWRRAATAAGIPVQSE
jgi:hypothetical protein